jgi:hypothetical protein
MPIAKAFDEARLPWAVLLAAATWTVAAIFWGSRIDAKLTTAVNDIEDIQTAVSLGILPRSDERIRALERRILEIERALKD